ncbi:F-actin-uncapping protein LRRC16A-like [Eucyclogobius newberryi]|uniref:F-actin-uncapping protein LRRC16A-like n=1 Tax=Eucyclogobius newberryi TaxID=166745 RepID=UPI003B593D68
MTEETDLPKELREGVAEALGRGLKVELKLQVQLELKDKVESRVLVSQMPSLKLLLFVWEQKVEQSFSLLDLQGVNSHTHTQLVLEHDRGCWTLRSVLDVDEVIAHIGLSLQKICPALAPAKLLKKLNLKPAERSAALLERWSSAPELGPCGGFSGQYRCVCDHMGLPQRDEVQWDVDTIYLTQDTKELNLQDFIHLENRDLVPIIAVLEHNQWFTKLSIKDHKLSTEVCDQILRVVARSSRLEELVLDNVALRSDFSHKFSLALAQNPDSALHSLCLCNNSLEDKGVSVLSSQLAKLPLGLKRLKLSRTGLTPKGVNSVCQALSLNPAVGSRLQELDLSGNSLRGDDLQQLQSFLAQSNILETLDLSHSDCSMDQICSSLLRGSLQHLSVLNLSKCVFSHRKCKEISSGFKLFFSSALSLSSVSLSGTKLPLDALKALLLGLGCNPNLRDVSLDLSSCDLRSSGSQILEGCIAEIPNITSLDISDNGLDMDLVTLLVWLSRNRSIRHLALGKNFSNIKTKNLSQVLDSLVQMIQEEDSILSSLSLADSRLKSDLSIVLNALGSNSSLVKLDISGNAMGDLGAKILSKALQINTKLRTIFWDRNSVSPQGLQDVASALEKNFTIRFMPVPIVDAAQALKAHPEKTEDALLKMEQFLLRNHETRKYLQEQNYRLQQSIVTTTTQQMMDTVCVKVQDHLNSLRFSESSSVQEDVKRAQNLMKDARNSKTLLPSLYHLQNSGSRGPCVGAVHHTLMSMSGQVFSVMDQQLQTLLEQMVGAAQTLCPHVMQKKTLRQELLHRGAQRKTVPESFICSTLEQTGGDICNKISEVKLNMASFLSDQIVDEILESLSQSQNILSDHVKRKARPLEKDTPSEPEVIDETELLPQQETEKQEEEVVLDRKFSTDSDSSVMKSKRRSILVRMLRPVSVAFEMEFDLDKALEQVPIHIEDPPPPTHAATPLDRVEAPPPLSDLPLVQIQTLEHHTKSRPRPKNRTKPSRSKHLTAARCCVAGVVDSELNRLMEKVDEGLDDFFSKTVSKLSFKRAAPLSCSEKKRKSGFFSYIKSRTSRSEKSPAASAAAPPAGPAAAPPAGPAAVPPAGPAAAPPAGPAAAPPGVQEEELCPDSPTASPEPKHKELECGTGDEMEQTHEREDPASGAESRPEKEPDALPAPAGPRHMGVPVLGAGLMAEIKAKLAHKSEAKTKPESSGAEVKGQTPDKAPPPSDPEESRPEPAPRSRPRTSTSSGPTSPSPASLQEECVSAPLPAPRLKRALSEQDKVCSVSVSSPVDGQFQPQCASDSDTFSFPVSLGNVAVGNRTCLSPECETRDEQETATSLLNHVTLDSPVSPTDPGSAQEQSAPCGSDEEQA